MKDQAIPNVEFLLLPFAKGQLSDNDSHLVEAAINQNPDLRDRVNAIQDAAILEAWENATPPTFGLRGKVVFEAFDAAENTNQEGPPIIHSRSRIQDFQDWIDAGQAELKQIDGNLAWVTIAKTEDTNSYLVRISKAVENPARMRALERILVVDGHCSLHYGDRIYQLGPGDSFQLASTINYAAFTPNGETCTFICQRTRVGN